MDKAAAFAVFGLFFLINTMTLNGGHNWGDDFAQYAQHAVNLAEHRPYASNIALDLWVVVPPGFPLLLSPLIHWFGINFKILKFLNVLLWALAACAVYGLALNRLGLFWARMVTVWFLTSPFFFFFKQNILSDIPFTCFVLLTLWSFMKYEAYEHKEPGPSRTFLFLSLICMCYACLIRWAGVSLLLAALVYFTAIKQDWKKAFYAVLSAGATAAVAFCFGSSAVSYFNKTAISFQDWMGASWSNIAYTLQVIFDFYISKGMPFSKMTPVTPDVVIKILAGLFVLGAAGWFLHRLCCRRVSFMACFMFFYLLGVFLWPVTSQTRYVLPAMVPITIFIIQGARPFLQKFTAVIFLSLILFNALAIAYDFRFNDDEISQKASLEMMQWVARNVKPEEHYMFYKPRALALLSGRVGATFWVYPQDEKTWYKRIKPLHITYLIGTRKTDQFSQYNDFYLRVDNYELYFKRIWENAQYKIFKVKVLG